MLLQKVRVPAFYDSTAFHYMNVPQLSIRSSTDEPLDCFQVLAIVSNAAINIGVHIFFQTGISGFLGYIPRSGIAES